MSGFQLKLLAHKRSLDRSRSAWRRHRGRNRAHRMQRDPNSFTAWSADLKKLQNSVVLNWGAHGAHAAWTVNISELALLNPYGPSIYASCKYLLVGWRCYPTP